MKYRAEIPYGAYWSTPFTRWQGSFAHLHSLQFGAWVARKALEKRGIDAAALARMTCPIGIAGIADKAPASIAVAVAEQLLREL